MEWTFNLEKAPWWGGIYERMIKSVKRCMRKAVGKSSLSYDELLTLVVEIEGVVNSRPLTYLSADDFGEPLTPSHLLTGRRIVNLPDPFKDNSDLNYDEKGVELTRRMKYLSNLMDKFWKKWRSEYLTELREHHRYVKLKRGVKSNVLEGDMVTVFDENYPRGFWRLGRIHDVITSTDGLVRAATVQVQSKTGKTQFLRRPIQHLYPLEVKYDETRDIPDDKTVEIEETEVNPAIVTNGGFVGEDNQPELILSAVHKGQEGRPLRQAAVRAQSAIRGCLAELND